MEEFRTHAAKHGYNLQDPDMSIAQYLNSLFWKGEQPHKGEKFLAAWLHRYPEKSREPKTPAQLAGVERVEAPLPNPLSAPHAAVCLGSSCSVAGQDAAGSHGAVRAPFGVHLCASFRAASLPDTVLGETYSLGPGRMGDSSCTHSIPTVAYGISSTAST